MDKDRQAVESIRRNERIKSATTADEKRLAEVESAVIASKQKLIDDEAQMRASGKYADGYITTQMAERKEQVDAYIAKLKTSIVDPIASKKNNYAATIYNSFDMSKRTDDHREQSNRYIAATRDEKERMLNRATTGKDDILLTEALLTGEHGFTDVTMNLFKRKIAPPSANQKKS